MRGQTVQFVDQKVTNKFSLKPYSDPWRLCPILSLMNKPVQTDYQISPDPSEGFELKVLQRATVLGTQAVVLQANIEGRDRKFWLPLDDLPTFIQKDPAVAEALRGIAKQFNRLADAHGTAEEIS